MNAETLMELAGRCEKASADQQGRLIEEAWEACAAYSAKFRRFAQAWTESGFDNNAAKFSMALEARAYESAAIMLVPEGHFWSITMRGQNRGGFDACCLKDGPMLWREASTPALALVSAALKARAQEGK